MIPDDAWPTGDVLEWWDDDTRTHHDFLNDTTRPYTEDENAAADARAIEQTEASNEETLRTRASAALVANREFLAIARPTEVQTVAQVKALTRQMNALARLVLGDLTGTD